MVVFSRADLIADGFHARDITAAVREGTLIRARRDHYMSPDANDELIRAVRVGGRLTCLSLLVLLGVFVLRCRELHVHVMTNSARLRSPHDRSRPLESRSRRGVRLHWTALRTAPGPLAHVDVVDALVHAVRCQAPRAAVATLDSAVRLGIVGESEVAEIFEWLPRRYGVLRRLMDPRVESGTETLVGLMLRSLGCRYTPQVTFAGIGRVDFVVGGWLIVECDSEKHHGTWTEHERDLRRDAMLAARGYVTLRLSARVIMYEPDVALEALRGLLEHRR